MTTIASWFIILHKEVGYMPAGKVAPNKTRTNITIEKELKITLEQFAKEDGRSFNGLIIKVLSDYVKKRSG